jgi:hypothetical protein
MSLLGNWAGCEKQEQDIPSHPPPLSAVNLTNNGTGSGTQLFTVPQETNYLQITTGNQWQWRNLSLIKFCCL